MNIVEHVPHGKWPSAPPTNKERWQEWMAKWAMANEPLGNSRFQFAPIFDPPDWYNKPSFKGKI